MSYFSRVAVAAMMIAGLGAAAQAQADSRRASPKQDQFEALYNGGRIGETTVRAGAVPPSMSNTVMGLRVPR